MDDEDKADQFIKECAEQCHNKKAELYWGKELVDDIVQYAGLEFTVKKRVTKKKRSYL